jgi:hypothetical protein
VRNKVKFSAASSLIPSSACARPSQ